jgi:dihydrofolate reductase
MSLASNMPQVNLIAAVDHHGGIGRKGELPIFSNPDEARFWEQFVSGLTEDSVVITGKRTMDLMVENGFSEPPWNAMVMVWHRPPGISFTPEAFMTAAQGQRKPIFIIGGHETYHTFMPFVQQLFIRRVAFRKPSNLFLPDLLGVSPQSRRMN